MTKEEIEIEYKDKTPEEKEFIMKAIKRYGDKYTYHNLSLKTPGEKVTITCRIHGDFKVKGPYFLHDKWCIGCPECYREEHFKSFWERLRLIFPRYSIIPGKTKYITSNTPLWLHCDIHGVDFKSQPDNLLMGKCGCKECCDTKKRETNQDRMGKIFKERIEKAFPGQFDFSEYKYINLTTKVTLICKKCGEKFEISPDQINKYINHSEKLCPTERWEESRLRLFLKENNLQDSDLDDLRKEYPGHSLLDYIFIYRSKSVWKDIFDYSEVDYKDISTPVKLIMKSTGKSYYQLPWNNLKGKNPSRSSSGGEELVRQWLEDNGISYKYRDLLSDLDLEGRIPGSKVEIDFTLQERKIWIEYNGEQHYRRSPKFYPTQEEYLGQLRRDENVREYTKENRILFIEIPWTYNTYSDIDSLLTKIILLGESPGDLITQPEIIYE